MEKATERVLDRASDGVISHLFGLLRKLKLAKEITVSIVNFLECFFVFKLAAYLGVLQNGD